MSSTHTILDDDSDRLPGQRGACIWLTGLPGSGKTTIARTLEAMLRDRGVYTHLLDGDEVRARCSSDLGFSMEDRTEHLRRASARSARLCEARLIVLCAFVSPLEQMRRMCRAQHPEGRFIECHIACALAECEARDPKGLYALARQGRLDEFTGVSSPYEVPLNPELTLHTDDGSTAASSAQQILDYLESRQLISPAR